MSAGLILEGGGTRGWYTGGVLTVLNAQQIKFSTVYGVSAGALNALAYISKQINQNNAMAYMKNMRDKRYMGIKNLQKTGSFFNFDYILEELPHEIPFDYKTFFRSSVGLKVGTTDLRTGKSVYFNKNDLDENFTAVRASCSLPFIGNIIEYHDYNLLDGGCSEPIPIKRSMLDGNQKNVIVLTQHASYCEKPGSRFSTSALRVKYRRYPNFVASMEQHSMVYNDEISLCSRLEKEGKAIVIRPSHNIVLRRYNDIDMLIQMYKMGIRDCKEKIGLISRFVP